MSDARRVLILDDEPMVGVLIESVARIDGALTRLTAHPDDFLRTLQDWLPTHIVLDLTLPGMSGEDVLRQIAAKGCAARIVLTSGVEAARLDAAEALARELGLEVAGVIGKPFLPARLRALLV
jgi:CheY-like chemotaxis protein